MKPTRLRTLPPRLSTLPPRLKPPPKTAAPFYLSPAWRSLVARLIFERGPRCQQCGRTGCRLFGDHVRELKDQGEPLDPGNVRLLCGSCHSTKTAKARSDRMTRPVR
jgi:5-methylcytosine-specific restriction endonuclease McrA